jgi:uracil-DNA glycosylase
MSFFEQINTQPATGWNTFFAQEQTKAYFTTLMDQLAFLYATQKVVPPQADLLRAFSFCPPEHIKGVILGQDPYPTAGLADGLAFSSRHPSQIPASLRTLYKELQRTRHWNTLPTTANLTPWAQQGVLLLNASLTTQEGHSAAHTLQWNDFTQAVLKYLSDDSTPRFFLLMGKVAQKKAPFIINKTGLHCLIKTVHPSPLAGQKFVGCDCFKTIDAFLHQHQLKAIEWHPQTKQ